MPDTNIAIVGCGFVADYYLKTLQNYSELRITGVYDWDTIRAENFAQYHHLPVYATLEELLEDQNVTLVVNLTNPKSHYEITLACLKANKHVYSEKPLAMDLEKAEELVDFAERQGLYLASAPCNLLSEAAQTMWKALREEIIGKVYLVYGEMDDGLIHKMPYKSWVSESGIPWPYIDEFEVGCTLEHAGYYLSWFPAFFGRAESVTAFGSTQIKDKETDIALEIDSADFSVACIKFASGVVVRLTCSIIAPHDHSLRIFGEEGIISIKDCWFYNSPVYVRRMFNLRRKRFISPIKQKYKLKNNLQFKKFNYRAAFQMDFARGIAEVVDAIKKNRPCRISARYSLHVNELALAIHNARQINGTYKIKSSFEPIEPMPWAK